MDYVFDLQEKGKRILYAQGGRIIGLMPQGRLIRQAAVLQEDFLADLTAALHGGRVYYAYHSLEHRVVLHTLEEDVPLPLLSDVSGSRQYGHLALGGHGGTLFFFYTSAGGEGRRTGLYVRCPYREPAAEYRCGEFQEFYGLGLRAVREGLLVHVQAEEERFFLVAAREEREGAGTGGEALRIEEVRLASRKDLGRLETELAGTRRKLEAAVRQYGELRSQAAAIQEEGRRWREKCLRGGNPGER